LAWILKETWFWIIIVALLLVFVTPFIFVVVIMNLPTQLKIVATFAIVIGWGVAAGYKDWAKSKRKEEEKQSGLHQY
jgi:hypothetical protein